VLKLKQGFGRLIRTHTDRGSVVILDPRMLTKHYGRVFLESLPPAAVEVEPFVDDAGG
jgi:ATP-dependent DNA helicase DinG